MNPALKEPLILTALLLVVLKSSQFFLPGPWFALAVPTLLLYLPFLIYSWKKRPIDFLDRSPNQFFKGFGAFLIAVLIVFPPYLFFAHVWMIHVFDLSKFSPAPWTAFTQNLWYQLLVVALPEEFYFRGYLQTTLKKVFQPSAAGGPSSGRRWKIFGVHLGWEWLFTALIFAFAHSVIQLKWWHFSIFFPALLFGYLRERTGSITAPVLFHAFSNCFMNWFAKSYF